MATIWVFVNSKIFLTVLTLSFGGTISSLIAKKWQQRKALFDLKLSAYKETIERYHLLVASLNNVEDDNEQNRRTLHARFIAANKLNRVIFVEKSIYDDWEFVAQNLSNLASYNRNEEKERVINKLKEKVFERAKDGIEKMLKEIKL